MVNLTIEQIMETLPHRYPMLLVDRIVECDDEKRIVGIFRAFLSCRVSCNSKPWRRPAVSC